MQNPEIEYFKRFSACYLMWAFSNFDRIVADAVRRQERVKAEEDEVKKRKEYENSLMGKIMNITRENYIQYARDLMTPNPFLASLHSGHAKLSTTLKIRLPADYKKPVPLSFWKKLLTGTKKLFRS